MNRAEPPTVDDINPALPHNKDYSRIPTVLGP